MKIAVIGGGLGGLCAALCFAHRGANVAVYERAAGFAEVGAGIQVSSNGMRVLDALGLGCDARRVGYLSQGVTLNNASGHRVAILPNGPTRETRLFHRADLLGVLVQAARDQGIPVHFDQNITPDTRPQADLVIAADGVRSVFRSWVTVDERPAAFTGQVAWRALVQSPRPVQEGGASVYMGPDQHVVIYPLRGGQVLNIVAVQDTKSQVAEGWNSPGDPAEMRQVFQGFGGPLPQILNRVEQVHHWGLFAHKVPRVWHRGNTVLLGDAAHAMLPFLAQGAVMAFEDAWVLAAMMDRHGAVGLSRYEAQRHKRVARVMTEAQANARRFHHANPLARRVGHSGLRVVSQLAPGFLHRRYSWLYDFDVQK